MSNEALCRVRPSTSDESRSHCNVYRCEAPVTLLLEVGSLVSNMGIRFCNEHAAVVGLLPKDTRHGPLLSVRDQLKRDRDDLEKR